jgi:hypothetical protein
VSETWAGAVHAMGQAQTYDEASRCAQVARLRGARFDVVAAAWAAWHAERAREVHTLTTTGDPQ